MSKRKALTLKDRVEAIRLSESGLSSRAIGERFGVGRTQIQNVLKRKAEVLTDFENNVPSERKRKLQKTGNEDINNLVWEWFKDSTSRNISVTGPMLKEKALKFAQDLSLTDFKASSGWLDCFVKRNNIVFGSMTGERGDVDLTVVDSWKSRLPEICKGYTPRDIFNMDESGLFFRDSYAKSFHVKGTDCAGGKRSKDRVTISLCANMLGEKETILLIGKSLNPRCMKNVAKSSLPVTYRCNSKAWMTSVLFEEWVKTFDRKMRRQNRNVLLFLDNAPSHAHLRLTNVTLQFFPANTTSRLQPMDQGIIQAVKLKYRKRQLQYLITQMDIDITLTGTQLLKKISLLDTIYWISRAWQDVDPSTITKCFERCGFSDNSVVDSVESIESVLSDKEDDSDDIDDIVPLAVGKMSRDIFGVEFSELAAIDRNLQTSAEARDWDAPAGDLLQSELTVQECIDSDEEDDVTSTSQDSDIPPATINDACVWVTNLKSFVLQNGHTDMLASVMDMQSYLTEISVKTKSKQTTIKDFFSRNLD